MVGEAEAIVAGVSLAWAEGNVACPGEGWSVREGNSGVCTPTLGTTPSAGASQQEQEARKASRKTRPRVPRTHDPQRIRQIVREVGEVIDTPENRTWYDAMRCDGAPAFPHYWAYVRQSMVYDVPGRELAGLVWEATERAFRLFDPAKRDAGTSVEKRFLKHWRSHLANLARKYLKVRPSVSLPGDLPGDAVDPLWGLMSRMLPDLVEELPEEDRRIIRLRYREGLNFGEIAKRMDRRKQTVLDRHNRTLATLRRCL